MGYFESERSRYEHTLAFWRSLALKHRQTFLRCAAYSNRRPESHPDYLAACPQTTNFAFVEVKGPDDYLRQSQERFFPELVSQAGQDVWVARSSSDGSRFAFHRFEGEALIRHETLFGKPIELHRPVG
jgi:VRR-NUC domain-containing protein